MLKVLLSHGGKHSEKGTHGIKNPLPVTSFRRGLQHTRRLDTHPHGALTSEAVYPLQRSSCKGCCSMYIPAQGNRISGGYASCGIMKACVRIATYGPVSLEEDGGKLPTPSTRCLPLAP